MIIWRGRGILILLAAIGCAVGLGGMAKVVMGERHLPDHWAMAIAIWGATLGAWISAYTFGKPEERILIDPRTQQPVRMRTTHSLYGVDARSWGILGVLASILVTVFAVMMHDKSDFAPETGTNDRLNASFMGADTDISSFHGTEALGNTPEAKKLAEQFANLVKEGRDMGIQKSKPDSFTMTSGHFMTYCQLDHDKCAFLIQIPDLRHFNKEAKEWMGDACWAVARSLTKNLDPVPKRLAVGIRGMILYDRALIGAGPVGDNPKLDGGIQTVVEGNDSKHALQSFFVPAAPAKTPSAVASSKPSSAPPTVPDPEPTPTKSEPESPAASPKPALASPKPKPAAPIALPMPDHPVPPQKPAPEALKKGNDLIVSHQVSAESGNMPEAAQLAQNYNQIVSHLLRKSVNKVQQNGEKSALDAAPLFSYCHLGDDSCVFIACVPDLTVWTQNAQVRELLITQLWFQARASARCLNPIPKRLAIAIRNDRGYDVAQMGQSGEMMEKFTGGVEQTLSGSDVEPALLPFFEPPHGLSPKVVGIYSLVQVPGNPPTTQIRRTSVPRGPSNKSAAATQPPSFAAAGSAPPGVSQASALPLPTPLREWKDSTGRPMKASLEKFTTPACDTAVFKREDGNTFEVPVSKFSAEDQAVIAKLAEQAKKSAP